jgi:hypothetical protein
VTRRKRFVVQTVTGFTASSGRPNSRHGLSAHVCDRVYLYEVVATFRNTDSVLGRGRGRRLGADGAVALAEAHAARLNDGR